MSWFNESEPKKQPIEVTFDRVIRIIKDSWGFNGNDEDAGKFYCYVNGVPMRFDGSSLPFAVYVNVTLFEHELDPERFDEALAWANGHNFGTHFTQATVGKTDGKVILAIDAPVLTEAGLTDEQLEQSLDVAVSAALNASKSYLEKFGFDLPEGFNAE